MAMPVNRSPPVSPNARAQRSFGRQLPSRQESEARSSRQELWQPPQFKGSLAISISQPSEGSPLQSAKPAAHSKPQPPAEQSGTLLGGTVHAFAQAPQCRGEESRSTHSPPQSVSPDAQSGPASSPGLAS